MKQFIELKENDIVKYKHSYDDMVGYWMLEDRNTYFKANLIYQIKEPKCTNSFLDFDLYSSDYKPNDYYGSKEDHPEFFL